MTEVERFAISLTTLGRLMGEHLPLAAAATQGEEHVLRWVNPAFCRLVGALAGDVIGHPFLDVVPAAALDGAAELLDRVLRTGDEASNLAPDLVAVHDGLPARSYSVAPLFGDTGAPLGLLVRVDDTTELMLARERAAGDELRDANQSLVLAGLRAEQQFEAAADEAAHLNALLESLHEAVTIADPAGRILLMNPAATALWNLDGHSLADAAQRIGELDLRRLDGTRLPPAERPLSRALHGERFSEVEIILFRPDGTQLRLLSSGSAIRDERHVLLAIVVHRDVTALRLLERTKEEYLALISHDLRSPLTAVQAEAQLLQRQFVREGNGDSPQVKRTQSIVSSAHRMNAMIQELLESSRLESGTMQLRAETLDLVRLVTDIVERETSQRVHFEPTLGMRPTTVVVDAERIERVLTNLITNALKYSPADTPVVVRVEHGQSHQAIVSVTDIGAGIPSDELAGLFQRFTRGRAGPKSDASGLGLGLYIARLIVETHGGRVWAESELDRGSTFSFSLAMATPTAASEDDPAAQGSDGP